jgi:peptidoglycan/LPS O-acetylase OafA/YrhL
MIKSFLSEIVVAIIIILLIFVLINPTGVFMPTMAEMTLIVGLVLMFGLFTLFVWREKAQDERDSMLRMMADRIGFLSGSTVLIVGIVIESLQHQLSDWLLIALASMVVAKIIGIVYGRIKY